MSCERVASITHPVQPASRRGEWIIVDLDGKERWQA